MFGYLFYAIRNGFYQIGRLLNRWRKPPDYVVFTLEGDYPDFQYPAPNFLMRMLRPQPESLLDFALHFQRIAAETRIKGVLLLLRPLQMSPAQLETLRDQIQKLKQSGKHVVCWSYTYDTQMYFLASAADELLLLPGGQLEGLGIRSTYPFLGEALQRLGIQADFIPISPYKTAGDVFTHGEMSDEMREMTNWILDSLFQQFLSAVQQGRKLDPKLARKRLDRTPCTDLQALELGLIDGIKSEEDLPLHLGSEGKPARLQDWEQSRRSIAKLPPKPPARSIALIPIEGMIVDGRSARPPIRPPIELPLLSESRAGDISVAQSARRALFDPSIAAAVVYINSRGGSATASKKIHSALAALAKEKPVVVCLGPTAASGGYYVAAVGKEILTQPSTITGSIGVVLGKIVLKDLLDRLSIGRETLARGRGVTVWDAETPFSKAERKKLLSQIERIYDLFVEDVAQAREMPKDEVLRIADGKVWTGQQAKENNLADRFGSLADAFERAAEFAELPPRPRVRVMLPDKKWLPPLTPTASTAAHIVENWQFIQGQRLLLLSHLWHPWKS